ncbi:MAG: amidase [Lautropia sp.]|nr:amidase [Lautropia sp.]
MMSDLDPLTWTLRQQAAACLSGGRSLEAELDALRARADAVASLRSLAWVDWDRAAQEVANLSAHIRRAPGYAAQQPLLGTWITVKDLFQLAGAPMQAGTRAQLPDLPPGSSEVVKRLQAAGALVFAKTNMHEIALGATGENPWTGDVCNPHDPARQAGGSSSGSGVAVAAGLGSASIGSDTGGSIRIPAAFCGVVGFKPTLGSVSLAGALPLSWSCDHAGPLARCVEDAALLHQILSGRSLSHARVARRPRLGVPHAWLKGRLDEATREHFSKLLARLEEQADLLDMQPDGMHLPWEHYTPIVRAEAARVHHAALAAGGTGFSAGVLAPLRAGADLPAQVYLAALQARSQFINGLDAVLDDVDALVLPTSAIATPRRGQTEAAVQGGPMSVREAVLGQTLPFSFAGVPAISLPAGHVWLTAGEQPHSGEMMAGNAAMPFGLQLVARRGGDAHLLALAAWLEGYLGRSAAIETGA